MASVSPVAMPPAVRRGYDLAAAVVATVAAGFALKVLAGVLVPFAVAVFLLVFVDAVARRQAAALPGLPRWTGAAVGVGLVALAFLFTLWIAAEQAAEIALRSRVIVERLDRLLAAATAQLPFGGVRMSVILDGPTVKGMAAARSERCRVWSAERC